MVSLRQQLEELKLKIKKLEKRNRKLKPKTSKTISGIVKPMHITKELAKYLGVEEDTKLARSTIAHLLKEIFEKKGIKDGNLVHADKDPETKKLFPSGGKLYPIDSAHPKEFGLSWRNMQKNLTHFIIKDEPEPKEEPEVKEPKEEPKEPKSVKPKPKPKVTKTKAVKSN